jgi:hypothetical protein
VNNNGKWFTDGPVDPVLAQAQAPSPADRRGWAVAHPAVQRGHSRSPAPTANPASRAGSATRAPRPPRPRPSVGAPPITGLQRLRFAGKISAPMTRGSIGKVAGRCPPLFLL